MSPARLTAPLLLAAALAACSGDRPPTAPASTLQSGGGARVSAALASPSAASVSGRFAFTRISGRTVSSIALALPGIWCTDSDFGSYRYELRAPTNSLLLLSAKSATVHWSTRQRHLHHGTTLVREATNLQLAGFPIYVDGHQKSYVDPGTKVEYKFYNRTLNASELANLRGGAGLVVVLDLQTQATVFPGTCGVRVAGVQARTEINTAPYLELAT
jgi:hypothetical protein